MCDSGDAPLLVCSNGPPITSLLHRCLPLSSRRLGGVVALRPPPRRDNALNHLPRDPLLQAERPPFFQLPPGMRVRRQINGTSVVLRDEEEHERGDEVEPGVRGSAEVVCGVERVEGLEDAGEGEERGGVGEDVLDCKAETESQIMERKGGRHVALTVVRKVQVRPEETRLHVDELNAV